MAVTWGAVNRPKQGQSVSGDAYLVQEGADGRLLVAVIDGLGGGQEAARAAQLAQRTILEHGGWELQDLVHEAHRALHQTRGAVIGLLRLDTVACRASYVGVGNVGVQVYSRLPIKPISKSGILGFRLPALLELRYTYEPGDVFVLYSDGVSARFGQDSALDIRQQPQAFVEQVLAHYGKTVDDATVVALRT
jgi:serine phosphatase RsbU (regulator of sigma subunit)